METVLTNYKPWLPDEVIEWLEGYLKQEMQVFEYGSGGSTIWIAKRVKKIISVEHQPKWFNIVRKGLAEEKLINVILVLKEPHGNNYTEYIQVIDSYPEKSFDLILVDGRNRVNCVGRALSKVKSGGYLLLDNSDRHYYCEAMVTMRSFDRTDFVQFTKDRQEWRTSIWRVN